MRVELLMAGDELLAGAIIDSNAPWLMARLHDLGFRSSRKTTVGDDAQVIAEGIEAAASRGTELLVVCGGLGPTEDDVTAEAAAIAAGAALEIDPAARRMVEERLRLAGLAPTSRQLRQARLPRGASALDNPNGTAPGFHIVLGACTAFFFPGPPREFLAMAERHLFPWLAGRSEGDTHAALILRCFGRGESTLADTVDPIASRHLAVQVGYQVVFPEIHLRLRAHSATSPEARRLCGEAAAELRSALGPLVFGEGEETLSSVLGELLHHRGETLGLAESCTGGLLGSLLTEAPGSSHYLLGSLVTYSNEMKVALLGVSRELLEHHGAVSEPCALAMAEGALVRTGAAHALSVTGIAGPGGGSEEKPVGTVCFGVASAGLDTVAFTRRFPGDREMVRRVAAFFALDLLRRRLIGAPATP